MANDYKTQLTSLIQQIYDLEQEASGENLMEQEGYTPAYQAKVEQHKKVRDSLSTAQRMILMLAPLECYTDDWDSGAWKHDTAITLVEYATKLEDEIERDQ